MWQLVLKNIPPGGQYRPDGYRYYIDWCKRQIKELGDMNLDKMEQKLTWQAMIIVLEALIRFAGRYAKLAEDQWAGRWIW